MYGASPQDDSPRVPQIEPFEPFQPLNPVTPFVPPFDRKPIVAPLAQPRGEAVEAHLMTDETLIAVEQHCIAMVRYLSLPRDQRAAVDRWIEAARKLVGRVELDAEIYQTARVLAEGTRGHSSRGSK